MAKVGRPTKYKPEYGEQVIEFMGRGLSKEAFCGEIGIHKDTLYQWIGKYVEFADAIKKAEAKCRIFWEEMGLEMALHGQGNSAVWIFNMKNRFGWRDRTETEIVGKDGQQIPIYIFGGGFLPASPTITTQSTGDSPRFPQIQSFSLAPEKQEDNDGLTGTDKTSTN